LPICGHSDCKIPFDTSPDSVGHVAEADVAAVIKRAEDEVFGLLKTNWPLVKRVVNALCKQARLTVAEFEALIAGKPSAATVGAGSDSAGLGRAEKPPSRRRPKPVRSKSILPMPARPKQKQNQVIASIDPEQLRPLDEWFAELGYERMDPEQVRVLLERARLALESEKKILQ
jgi:hypothetical protein